jgi:hypothetical protein
LNSFCNFFTIFRQKVFFIAERQLIICGRDGMGGEVGWGVVEDIEVRFGWDLDLGMSVGGLCMCM